MHATRVNFRGKHAIVMHATRVNFRGTHEIVMHETVFIFKLHKLSTNCN